MKCKDFQKLLYLNREGERTPRQEKKLARHLHRCRVCANEKLKIEKINKLTTIARETIPHHSNPQELTNSIMNSIDQLKRAEQTPLSAAKILEPVTGSCRPMSRIPSLMPLSIALFPANKPVRYAALVEDVEYFHWYLLNGLFDFLPNQPPFKSPL